MPVKIRSKHSSVAGKAPLPADLVDGELALNINATNPALYIKDSAGVVRKLAGISVGATTPASPTAGMAWLDTTVPTKPVFKVYDGTAWQGAGSGTSAGSVTPAAPAAGDLWVDTTVPTAPVLKVYNGTAFVAVTPDASETVKGVVELATAAEVTAGTDTTRAVTPAGLKVELSKLGTLASPTFTGTPSGPTAAAGTDTTQLATTAFVQAAQVWTKTGTTLGAKTPGDLVAPAALPAATAAAQGAVQLADAAAITAGTAGRVVDAAQLKAAAYTPTDATETAKGIVELATAAETTTGTDGTRAVHPAGLKVELDKKVNKAGDTMTGNLTVPSLNGGQLAGFRNILINGDLKINQRGVTIAAAAVGAYGPDRWKKVDAGNMTQIVEDVNYVPGATYTLSGTGVTTRQLTAPTTGHWTLPSIPIAATNIQLEQGPVATPFERRPYGVELALCQRYFCSIDGNSTLPVSTNAAQERGFMKFPMTMRAVPTLVFAYISGTGATWITGTDGAYQSANHSTTTSFSVTAAIEL